MTSHKRGLRGITRVARDTRFLLFALVNVHPGQGKEERKGGNEWFIVIDPWQSVTDTVGVHAVEILRSHDRYSGEDVLWPEQ